MKIIGTLTKLSPVPVFLCKITLLLLNKPVLGRLGNFSLSSIRWMLCVGLFISATALQAASWYVSGSVSSSGNGNSWATAWKSPSNISWGSVAAGDIIYLDGGASGMSYTAFGTITASGTSGNYITIARSTESGRDGIVTIATPCAISGSYIKFDGGGYKQVSGTTYRCGIVFTCNGNTYTPVSFTGGQAVNVGGQRPWFRYVYFNGTYTSGQGNSLGVRNNTGFVLENCWFYQANYEDQLSWSPSGTGGQVAITNCVFQDNVNVGESNPPHRDILNTWTGSGGYSLYIVGNIIFNSPGRSPQGDGFLLQDAYGGSAAILTQVVAINNVCYNYARFIAFGSKNSGHNGWLYYNNTTRSTTFGPESISYESPASGPTIRNHLGTTYSNPGFVDGASPLGADGIPFTADDGFNLTSGSAAINAGSSVAGLTTDIRGNTRVGNPDLGAYEYGSTTGQSLTASAGADKSLTLPSNSTSLVGSVFNPLTGLLNLSWSLVSGPGTVTFGSPSSATTTATFSSAGTYTLRLTASVLLVSVSDDVVVTVNPAAQVLGLSFQAESGVLNSPFAVTGGYISQPAETDISSGGRAVYSFTITNTGEYVVQMLVNASADNKNSIFANVDAEPTDPAMIWDIPITSGFESQLVSLRGNGTFDNPQFVPAVFNLTAGVHQLILRGREADVQIDRISIVPYSTVSPPQNLHVISGF